MKLSSNTYNADSKSSLRKENSDVCTWYVFFSEREQRDYYYEPSTNRVQWEMPYDLHRGDMIHLEDFENGVKEGDDAVQNKRNNITFDFSDDHNSSRSNIRQSKTDYHPAIKYTSNSKQFNRFQNNGTSIRKSTNCKTVRFSLDTKQEQSNHNSRNNVLGGSRSHQINNDNKQINQWENDENYHRKDENISISNRNTNTQMKKQIKETSNHNKSNRKQPKKTKLKNSSPYLMDQVSRPSNCRPVHGEELQNMEDKTIKHSFPTSSSKSRSIPNLDQPLTETITLKRHYIIRSIIIPIFIMLGSYVITKVVVTISTSTHSIDLQHFFTADISVDVNMTDNNYSIFTFRNPTINFPYHIYQLFSKKYKAIMLHIPNPLLSLWGDLTRIDNNARKKMMDKEKLDEINQHNKVRHGLDPNDTGQKYKPKYEQTYIQAESNQSLNSQKIKVSESVNLKKMESEIPVDVRNKVDYNDLLQPLSLIEKELLSFIDSISFSSMPTFQINQNKGEFNNLHCYDENSDFMQHNDQEHFSIASDDGLFPYPQQYQFLNKIDGIMKSIVQINNCYQNNDVHDKNTGSTDKVFDNKNFHSCINRQRKELDFFLSPEDATFKRAQKIKTMQSTCQTKSKKEFKIKDENISDQDNGEDETKRKTKIIEQSSLVQSPSIQVQNILNEVAQQEETIIKKQRNENHFNSSPMSQPSSMRKIATIKKTTRKEIFRRKPNKCDIPFAYIASKKCRRQSKQMPLLDMDNFLHFIIQ